MNAELRLVYALVAAPVLGLGLPQAGGLITIEVDDYRPLVSALDRLQSVIGGAINYEDVPYESAADLEDSSTPEQRRRVPGFAFMVPRKGRVSVTVPESGVISPAERIAAVNALLTSYRSNNLPGDFGVEVVGENLYVVPSRVQAADGTAKEVRSLMSVVVTTGQVNTTVAEGVQVLLEALSKTTGKRIEVGSLPFLPSTRVAFSATREPARDVLARILETLGAKTSSYRLLYDPVVKYYMLNVQTATAVVGAEAPVGHAVGTESTGNPFFGKP